MVFLLREKMLAISDLFVMGWAAVSCIQWSVWPFWASIVSFVSPSINDGMALPFILIYLLPGAIPEAFSSSPLKWQFDQKKCVQIHLFTTFSVQVRYWTTVFALEVSSVEEMQCIKNLAKRVRHYFCWTRRYESVSSLVTSSTWQQSIRLCLPCLRCQILALRSVTMTWRTSENHSILQKV